MRNYCPCKDCDKRQIGCHSTCKDYKEYCDLNKAEREKAYKERLVGMQIYEMEQERKRKSSSGKRPSPLMHGRKKK